MARKKRDPPSGPNNGYLISFGDTMTALLAFFIVLNSLANEQTGADLHSGTGSFMEVSESMGVPGLFSRGMTKYPTQFPHMSPLYIVPDGESTESDPAASGPDEDGDSIYIRDREQDNYERFLHEMERLHYARPNIDVAGEMAFDRLASLPRQGDLIDAGLREQLLHLAPILQRENYEVEIIVWASTPGASAWQRAASQANQLLDEVVALLRPTPEQLPRLSVSSSPWIFSDVKRPTVSIMVRRRSE